MPQRFPVSILIDYLPTPENRWQDGRWAVSGVVAGDPGAPAGGPRPERLHAAPGRRQWLWHGLQVQLHTDDAESYYFNILSDTPRIFVICSPDADTGLKPLVATLSYDEAASYLESDDIVEAVSMPAQLYRWAEAFVLRHYVPVKKRKRKRDDWKAGAHGRDARH